MRDRTLLYGLPLRDEGKATVESLRSYVQRLAFAHCLKPRALLELVIEQSGGCLTGPGAPFHLGELVKDWSVHAGGRTGTRLVQLLQAATGVDPSRSTLAHIANLVAEQHLVQAGPGRYCPVCVRCDVAFGEDADPETGHGQLLWEVSAVAACPVHGVRLRQANACGAEEGSRLPVNVKPSLSHVCRGCGSISFRCVAGETEAATAGEIAAAHQIGRVLAAPRDMAEQWSEASLLTGLRAAIDAAFEGQVVRAARELGLSRGSVCTWAGGKGRPNLSALTRLACHAGLDLAEIFSGRAVRLVEMPQVQAEGKGEVKADAAVSRLRGYRRMTDPKAIEQALRDAVLQEDPPSLRQVADLHGISPRQMRELWPALTDALVEVGATSRQQAAANAAAQALATYERSAMNLKEQGVAVTAKSLQKASGLVAFSQNRARVAAMRQVIRKFGPA